MRVLVLGAGATGAFFGARLIQSGADVSFLVRPRRAELLARHGLRVRARRNPFEQPVQVLTSVPASARFDLILLACKAYDLDAAIQAIRPALGPGTLVLPILNGLRHFERLDAAFGADRVLAGLCHISVALEGDGGIGQVGSIERLEFGSRPGMPALSPSVRDGLMSMSDEVVHSSDVMAALWNKFVLLSALAAATCLMRASVGAIVAAPGGSDLMRWLYLECAEVARRSAQGPDEAAMHSALSILTAEHSPLKASMLGDMEKGQRTEVEHILGDMLGRAQRLGVDAPLLTAACTRLRIHEAALAAV